MGVVVVVVVVVGQSQKEKGEVSGVAFHVLAQRGGRGREGNGEKGPLLPPPPNSCSPPPTPILTAAGGDLRFSPHRKDLSPGTG